jgi:hypothetical protein
MSGNPVINSPPKGRTIAVVGDVYRFLAIQCASNKAYLPLVSSPVKAKTPVVMLLVLLK